MRKNGKIFKRLAILTLVICIFASIFNIGKVLAAEPTFKLDDVIIDSKSDGVDASIVSFDDNELIADVTFHRLDDYVIYKLTIRNTSDVEYKLKLVSDNSGNHNIDYEYEYNEDELLAPDSTKVVTLKAVYKTELTNINNRNQNDEFKITFVMEDEKGNISSEDIYVNPKTNDSIMFYVNVLIISTVCLLLIIVKSKKAKKTLVLMLLATPLVVNAVSPSLVVTFINNTNLYDKLIVNKVVNGENVTEIVDYNSSYETPEAPVVEGYNFEGWYVGDEPYVPGTELTEDVTLTAKLTPIQYQIEYNLDNGNATGNPTSYNIETETFDLINPTKQGYTFAGWTGSNGDNLQTRVTIEQGSTGNKSFVAHYSPNQDTTYYVVHKYKNLDGTTVDDEEELHGATGTVVTPSAKSKYGFVDPELEQLEILPTGEARLEYTYERDTFELTYNAPDDITTDFPAGSYPYETQISVTAKTKEHYDFVEWSNGSTNNSLSFKITEDIEIHPVYEAKEYTIHFDAQGGVDVDDVVLRYDEELGELPETAKTNYILDGWYTDTNYNTKITSSTKVQGTTTYYAKWRKSVALANISNEDVVLERFVTETITLTNVEEEYTFTSNNSTIASVDEEGVITAKAKGTTTITITGTESNKTRTINVEVFVLRYIVTFDSQGGNQIDDREVDVDSEVGTLPTPTNTNSDLVFLGWFTAPQGGTEVTAETIVDDDITYYAHWTPLVCKIATSLHTEECNKTSDGCYAAGYRIGGSKNTTTITFGKVPDTSTPTAGYAYDCDVNGDGTYNPTTERFYYLRTKDDNAVLISHTNFEGVNEQIITGSYVYDEALTMLPTTTQWSNLPVTFGNYAARFPEYDDLKEACNKSTLTSTGDLDSCVYVLENSRFSSDTQGRSGVWLEKVNSTTYRYHTNTRAVSSKTTTNAVRPAIEVPLILLDKRFVPEGTKIVTFDSQGGSSVNPIEVEVGNTIDELPQITKNHATFQGWYTNTNYDVEFTTSTTVNDNITVYAKWSYASSNEIVNFNTNGDAMQTYFNNIGTWKSDTNNFQTLMTTNFDNYNCKCKDNTCSTSGTVACDKPKGYDTGVSEKVNVYLSDEITKEKGALVEYTLSDEGVIYNMIPGQTYYWELESDENVYGYVKSTGTRRVLEITNVGNARDLGGLSVDVDNDGTVDGTLKYGKLFRGEKLGTDDSIITELNNLGIAEEVDLRAASERGASEVALNIFKQREIKHYQIDMEHYPAYYTLARNTLIEVMQDVVAGKSIYFHCRIGADRTGTLAYLLEGLLGVTDEDRLQDYELTFFSGLINRHRFYNYDASSSVSKTEKFGYMYDFTENNEEIYDWFMEGSTDVEADELLISQFRTAMINSN